MWERLNALQGRIWFLWAIMILLRRRLNISDVWVPLRFWRPEVFWWTLMAFCYWWLFSIGIDYNISYTFGLTWLISRRNLGSSRWFFPKLRIPTSASTLRIHPWPWSHLHLHIFFGFPIIIKINGIQCFVHNLAIFNYFFSLPSSWYIIWDHLVTLMPFKLIFHQMHRLLNIRLPLVFVGTFHFIFIDQFW